MDFNAWLTAKGFDAAAITDTQRVALQAAWRAEQNPPAVLPPNPAPATLTGATGGDGGFDAQMAAIEAENDRIDFIRKSTLAVMERHTGNPQMTKALREMSVSAIADKKTDKRAYELALLRVDRNPGPLVYSPSQPQATDEAIEAAICVAHRLPNAEKQFDERTLDAAHKLYRGRGPRLKQLLAMGARANGFSGDDNDFTGVCRAIVRGGGMGGRGAYGDHYGMRADVGASTGVQVPGILGNTANKFLAANFMNVDQSWRGIAKVRPVSDFKQITTYRMGGNNTFLRVAPSGEIKHGALSETSYTNQAKTYGRLLGISREDYINDDLNAFLTVAAELGRGAADGLNNIFWAAWLDDSNFFNTDGSKSNYDAGATDSVLSLAGLDNAESIFMVQTKADGTPLGATPKILLVPSSLKNTALTLMKSQDLVVGTTPASGPSQNIFAGRYDVVASPFLQRTTLNDENGVSQTVTGSSTAWYLLADPMDIPCIEVVFLDGRDTPTVETSEFEFDRLGLATRAIFDFGVARQEYRGGVKLKGAA